MIRVATYDNGEFKRILTFDTVDEMREAFAGRSESLTLRRVIIEAPAEAQDEQRVIPNDPTLEDGPDVETGLPILRYTYTVQDFTIEDVRANRLGRLAERYGREQERAGKTQDPELTDFIIAVMPAVSLVDVTSLSNPQKSRLTEQATIATNLQTNKANERTKRLAIEAAATIADIRAVDITTGWAE